MSVTDETIQDAQESLQRYEKRSERYSQQPEQWKQDHEAAMCCFDFEGLLAFGLSLYDYINRIDEAWRVKVYRNLVPHDPAVDKVIEELYRGWLKPYDRVLARLSALEKHFDVAGAKEFRSACREVQGILTPDEEFFIHDRLARLRDEAVDANRRGEAEEMRSIGD
ncbi:MAG TPA: hypothetical protein VKA46_26815 [Gemmataceae bacterium]|nr:hypothetical protein [Gemmataceae bacterium]